METIKLPKIGEGQHKEIYRQCVNWALVVFKDYGDKALQSQMAEEYTLAFNVLTDRNIPTFRTLNDQQPVEYASDIKNQETSLRVINLAQPSHLIYNHHHDSSVERLKSTVATPEERLQLLKSVETQLLGISETASKSKVFLSADCFLMDLDTNTRLPKIFVGNFEQISIPGVVVHSGFTEEMLEKKKRDKDRGSAFHLNTTFEEFNQSAIATWYNWLKDTLEK
jgi:hypothetical protein